MEHLSLKTAAELMASRSLDSLVIGAAFGLLAEVMLRIMPRQNAARRFAVWFSALLAIATIPLMGGVWSPAAGLLSRAGVHPAVTIDGRWAVYFLAAWAAVSTAFLFQIARSIWRLNALRRSCVDIDLEALDPLLRETLQKHGGQRKVTLCSAKQLRVPAAIGLWRPAVVVPEWATKELSSDELNQVVLHELAHLRRWDDWTNLAQQLVKSLFFFHPAVWWIGKKAALEREMACDDAVLAETARPRAYAECLAHLAERSLAHRSLALAQAALGKVRQMSSRVAQILDANRPAPTRSVWQPAVGLITVFAVVCSAWYSRAPRLVAFEEHDSSAPVPVVATAPAVIETSVAPKPILASLKQRPDRHDAHQSSRMTAIRAEAPTLQSRNLVRYAGAKASPMPVTETMWIVVERNESTAEHLRLQVEMWRVTILHSPVTTTQIPRKI
jgi:beta-lactamase regulating signal transducer with metallopeptidase domain